MNLSDFSKEQILRERSRLSDMKRRCNDPKNKDYKFYGARGIKICDEWMNNPTSFYLFALKENKGREGLTIDRIDPDGDYEPSNVRFVSRHKNCVENFIGKQGKDTPNFRIYAKHGGLYENQYEKKHFKDVCRHFCNQRRKGGWSLYESLNVPVGQRREIFWYKIEKRKTEFFNEIFLNLKDQLAIYPELGSPRACPKCKEESMFLRMDYPVRMECACGYRLDLQTVKAKFSAKHAPRVSKVKINAILKKSKYESRTEYISSLGALSGIEI